MLIRTTVAGVSVGSTVYPIDSVVNADDRRAAKLIAKGVAVSIESLAADVDDVPQSTHKFGAILALAGAAVTLDLTSLASAGASRAGTSTNFSAVHTIVIRNLGTGTMTLVVGGAAATQFADWAGGTSQTVKVPAGGKFTIQNGAAAGWTTSSKQSLKLDPGADTFKVSIAIGGIGS